MSESLKKKYSDCAFLFFFFSLPTYMSTGSFQPKISFRLFSWRGFGGEEVPPPWPPPSYQTPCLIPNCFLLASGLKFFPHFSGLTPPKFSEDHAKRSRFPLLTLPRSPPPPLQPNQTKKEGIWRDLLSFLGHFFSANLPKNLFEGKAREIRAFTAPPDSQLAQGDQKSPR